MGLDLALGGLILLAAIRGWFRGFALQAIHLVALVGGVYAAQPLRDLARPYAQEYLPNFSPGVLDRLLWWSSAVLTYVIGAGIATGIVRAYRRKPYLDRDLSRGDNGAGFLLGATKGFVVAAFLAAGVSKFAPGRIEPGGVLDDQKNQSRAILWSQTYRPAERIWESVPVQHFVGKFREHGLGGGVSAQPPTEQPKQATQPAQSSSAPAPVQTASGRPRTLTIPAEPVLDPNSPDFFDRFDREIQRHGLAKPKDAH